MTTIILGIRVGDSLYIRFAKYHLHIILANYVQMLRSCPLTVQQRYDLQPCGT